VRTTVTLDPDVAAKLETETRRTGRSFKEVINDAIRRGLMRQARGTAVTFTVESQPLGLLPGLSYANTEELLDRIEGPNRR
jgi:hypothetical protein